MDNSEIGVRRSRRPVRYSVTALLMVMTAACMLLVVFRPSQSYSVTAFFRIKQGSGVASSATRKMSPQEIEQHAEAYRVMATSSEVIDGALAEPGVAKLEVVKRQSNAAAWLKNRLNAFYPCEGEILEIRLTGHGHGVNDDERILDAVVDAYQSAADRRKRLAKPEEMTSDVTLISR